MALVVFTGGARSGKSSAAERLALRRQHEGVTIVVAVFGHAADGTDTEYGERIERHQAARPAGFETREYEGGLGWAATAEGELLLVDCLGTLLGRLMEDEWVRIVRDAQLADADPAELPEGFEAACDERLSEVLDAIVGRKSDTIVVTNEVGDGIVPAYATGRLFRDLLGRANRRIVDAADSAWLVAAGRLVHLSALPHDAAWPED